MDRLDIAVMREIRGVIDRLEIGVPLRLNAKDDVGGGHDQAQTELPLETFFDDVHVKQPEKPEAETETERFRGIDLVMEGAVLHVQLLERRFQIRIIRGVYRKHAGENDGFRFFVAGKRRLHRFHDSRERVSDAHLMDVLDAADQVADLAGGQFLRGNLRRGQESDFLDLNLIAGREELDLVPLLEHSVHDAQIKNDAPVGIVQRVEDERGERIVVRPGRRRNLSDDRFENLNRALAFLRRRIHTVLEDVQHVEDLLFDSLGVRGRQIDLVDDGNQLQFQVLGQVAVRERLGFDPLRGVDDQEGAFAGREGAGHFVGEVDVPGSVDQVEDVLFAAFAVVEHSDGLRLDRNPPLFFQFHRIEQLIAHFSRIDRSGMLQQPIRERALAVVDVGDNGEVSDTLRFAHRTDQSSPTSFRISLESLCLSAFATIA